MGGGWLGEGGESREGRLGLKGWGGWRAEGAVASGLC